MSKKVEGRRGERAKKRVPRDRYPKQRGTILKTDKKHAQGWCAMGLLAILCHIWGWETELFRGNWGDKRAFFRGFGAKNGLFLQA
jgi:hypothetical protein